MTIDLVVCNYNTVGLLNRFLETLHADLEPDLWQLWVSDNGSTDGSAQWLKTYSSNYNITDVLYNDNVGYARACNAMAAKGTSPYIGILNADLWISTAQVKQIVDLFETHPEAAVIGPKQRDENGLIRHAGIMWEDSKFIHRGWAYSDASDTMFRDFIECGTVAGSAYFIRRSVWEEMTQCPTYRGMFPEVEGALLPTPLYFEESGLSRHVNAHGYKVFYTGTPSIGHTWGGSTPGGNHVNTHFVHESRQIYMNFCKVHDIEIEKNLM